MGWIWIESGRARDEMVGSEADRGGIDRGWRCLGRNGWR